MTHTHAVVRPSVRTQGCAVPAKAAGWGVGGGAYLSDVLAHVLDDHLVSCDGLHGEQAPLVDAAATEAQLLLSELRNR